MAAGSTFPNYSMYLGVGFLEENKRNGKNLVAIVPRTQSAIVIICCVSVIPCRLPFQGVCGIL